jgi:hypothetical protein
MIKNDGVVLRVLFMMLYSLASATPSTGAHKDIRKGCHNKNPLRKRLGIARAGKKGTEYTGK